MGNIKKRKPLNDDNDSNNLMERKTLDNKNKKIKKKDACPERHIREYTGITTAHFFRMRR